MSYRIQAHLNGRNPRLEVHDADSGAVRLVWEYRRSEADAPEHGLAQELAVDELFRRLFLLTTEDYLRGGRE